MLSLVAACFLAPCRHDAGRGQAHWLSPVAARPVGKARSFGIDSDQPAGHQARRRGLSLVIGRVTDEIAREADFWRKLSGVLMRNSALRKSQLPTYRIQGWQRPLPQSAIGASPEQNSLFT